jgi:hypothetical protein
VEQGRRRVRAALFAAAVALVCLAVPLGAAAAEGAPGTLTAAEPRFDAGRVEAGTKVSHTYELRNPGTTDIPIYVKASCGCTATEYDRVIPAGGTGKVTAVLDTTRMRGKVEKSIDVSHDKEGGRLLTLTILAEPVRALLVEPTDQPALRGPAGALKPIVLTVQAPDDTPFEITAVETDAAVTASIQPFGPMKEPHSRHRVTLTPKADLAVGTRETTLTLVTTLPSAPRFTMPFMIVVAGPLVTNPVHLRVRPDRGALAVRVSPAGDGQPPFTLLRAEVSDPDFTAEYTRVADAPAWDVTVRYIGKATRHGSVNATVKLATDVPSQPFVLVRLSGRL